MKKQQNSSTLFVFHALAACWGVSFFPSRLYRIRGGGARLRRPSRERTLCKKVIISDLLIYCAIEAGLCASYRTIFPWMAQDTQYCSFRYIFGTA